MPAKRRLAAAALLLAMISLAMGCASSPTATPTRQRAVTAGPTVTLPPSPTPSPAVPGAPTLGGPPTATRVP